MHNRYCDGDGAPADYVLEAESLGMTALGFSSHAPVPFACRWCMKKEELPSYLDEIGLLRRQHPDVAIYTGLEVDFIPELCSPAAFRPLLDFTIGSIHFVESYPDGTPWEIDGDHQKFLHGLSLIFQDNMRDVVTRYYELMREMIQTSKPDIVGHLDKIKIQNVGGKFFDESAGWYRSQIASTLDVIEKEGVIVEVNTRGLYQKKTSALYPGPWILEMIHDRNIPVTLSSDAHKKEDIVNLFPETAYQLKRIGFTHISILKDGFWQQVKFNEDGITA